jgi:chromosome segregation protein
MRLKTLEIKGFKSFGLETAIHFDEDVIGIVGPNGSGKSNIVDAIRWVLGEQKSRELRLDSMSSVIFNGTKKRKPAGVASVSLTFENSKNLLPTDYHTVTITRVLYRSGESEYRLNNVPCRLKDITSLFLDTGIGSNSYAIIALGMVDDILADKENARRKMFEQAAGISKYKVRKRETLNKLKNTTEDLERVEDLLFEIEGNLKSLEKQARRTKRYFELKAEYRTLSLEMAVLRSADLKAGQRTVGKQLDEAQDAYRQIEVEQRQQEAQLESEKKANLDKEKALSERQRDLNETIDKIRSMENDRRIIDQKKDFQTQNLQRLNEAIQQARGKISQLEEDVLTFREDLHGQRRLEGTLEEQLDQAEEKLVKFKEDHGSLKADLDAIVEDQQTIERAIFELEKKKAVNSNQIGSLQSEQDRNQTEVSNRSKEIETVQAQVKKLETEEQDRLQQLETLNQAETKRKKELETTQQKIEEVNQKLKVVNRQLDAKRNEYQLTKSMVENLEGFPESIKFLSQSKHWKKEAPLLSDLLYVQEDYRVAIENYLEPYLSYYVVENLEEAYQAIKLLNDTQKGKANFFLLDAFSNYQPPMQVQTGALPAIELIETDATYRTLISHLLENVYITDKEEIAGNLPQDEITLLSRSGRFIQRKYSVSGGSIGLFEGKKIGRKKNLEVLEKTIQKAERQADKLNTEYHNLRKKAEDLKSQEQDKMIQQANLTLNRLAQEKVSLITRLENFQSLIQEKEERQGSIGERVTTLEQENQQIETELQAKRQELLAAKERIANTDGSYRQAAEQLSEASGQFNQKKIEFIQQQNQVAGIQKELSFRERQLEETKAQLQQNELGTQRAQQEVERLSAEEEELENQLKAAYAERKEKQSHLSETEQLFFKARGGINEIENNLRQLNKRLQEAQVLINNLKDKATEYRIQMTSLAERLQVEFQIDINDVINRDPSGEWDPNELTEKVERLKKRLDNYGEINPMAVDAYEEMKERYENISKQRDDILQAKEDLMVTIKEIEDTATSQFLESFEKARLYFIDVFRSLFTAEDDCDLILLDPEDPLESKIEIVAKPKGKRPQTISQLSGGEKTLTATALLFALYLLKPAPFCIFDEVDAPLDDANIEKFNKIIKKFSKDSQFIIVTHNKQTMAAVDTIYGVYMQEQGVSSVSHVDFRNFEHTSMLEVSN